MSMIHRAKLRREGEIPSAPTTEENKVVEKVEEQVVETPTTDEKKYSKSEIARMSTADLQKLAVEIGIEDADEMSGNALKPLIIEKLGL